MIHNSECCPKLSPLSSKNIPYCLSIPKKTYLHAMNRTATYPHCAKYKHVIFRWYSWPSGENTLLSLHSSVRVFTKKSYICLFILINVNV